MPIFIIEIKKKGKLLGTKVIRASSVSVIRKKPSRFVAGGRTIGRIALLPRRKFTATEKIRRKIRKRKSKRPFKRRVYNIRF